VRRNFWLCVLVRQGKETPEGRGLETYDASSVVEPASFALLVIKMRFAFNDVRPPNQRDHFAG